MSPPIAVPESPLKARREASGMSQSELARRSGAERHIIVRIEAGGRCIVKMSSLRALADALECEPAQLLIRGQGVQCGSIDELDEFAGDRGWRCASEADDLVGAVARSLGVEVDDPAVAAYVRQLVAHFDGAAEEREAA